MTKLKLSDQLRGWGRLHPSPGEPAPIIPIIAAAADEIDRLNARLDKVESALQFIGNACDLHADETDVGVTFREMLNPTSQSEPGETHE